MPSTARGTSALVRREQSPKFLPLALGTMELRRSQFKLFASWCQIHARKSIPASTETVALFLADMADRFRPETVDSLLSAIALAHRVTGRPFDRKLFTPITEGIKRTHGTVPRQAAAVTVSDLRAMVEQLPDTPQGVRDRAILTVGFAGALRCSELVGLDIGRMTEGGVGLITIKPEGARLELGRSKGDQRGNGMTKWLPRGGHPCPVEALERWLTHAQIRRGAAFRCIRRGGSLLPKRLPVDAVAKVVKRSVYRMVLVSRAMENCPLGVTRNCPLL